MKIMTILGIVLDCACLGLLIALTVNKLKNKKAD